MHQSTTLSLSQTIWPRWASTQFLALPIVQTLHPVTFWLCTKLRGCRYETIEELKEAVTKIIDTLTQEDFHGAFQKLLEQYKCLAAGGDYFEGDMNFMCVLSIKVPIRKISGKLFNDPHIKERNNGFSELFTPPKKVTKFLNNSHRLKLKHEYKLFLWENIPTLPPPHTKMV